MWKCERIKCVAISTVQLLSNFNLATKYKDLGNASFVLIPHAVLQIALTIMLQLRLKKLLICDCSM